MRGLTSRLTLALLVLNISALTATGLVMIAETRRLLDDELTASVGSGRSLAAFALQVTPPSERTLTFAEDIVRLISDDPRLSVIYRDRWGARRMSSPPPAAQAVPDWFVALVTPEVETAAIDLQDLGSIEIRPEPLSETASAWRMVLRALAPVVAGLLAVSGTGVLLTLGIRRMHRRLADGLARVASGETDVALPAGDPVERPLVESFNRMVERLRDMADRNARLARMVDRIEAEERADLARNLHDDIGPQLFAIDVDATAISALASADPPDKSEIGRRAAAIRAVTTEAKLHVRRLLGQLRPGRAMKIGLEQSLRELADFWNERYPDIVFTITVDDTGDDHRAEATFHAVAREAVANAVKHGNPGEIRIELRSEDDCLRMLVLDDGGGRPPFESRGFGITGMRERVLAAGGRLTIDRRVDVAGVAISVTLPIDRVRDGTRQQPGQGGR